MTADKMKKKKLTFTSWNHSKTLIYTQIRYFLWYLRALGKKKLWQKKINDLIFQPYYTRLNSDIKVAWCIKGGKIL